MQFLSKFTIFKMKHNAGNLKKKGEIQNAFDRKKRS